MKSATVRDLRFHFAEIEARLRHGEEIEIRKRKRPIARLVPIREGENKPYLPDFAARRRRIFGNKVIDVASILEYERGGRW
jgi:antitoxin (DNA-binding transcriptional repressor) of toxin-antitoxin stability system